MLSREKLERINQLAKKSKKLGLTPEEKKEQEALRNEYIKNFRKAFKAQLDSIKIAVN